MESLRTLWPESASTLPSLDAEWLETDGLGGFASGTVSGIRTRRYHALLLVATTPPTGRVVLVNGLEARVTTPGGVYDLTSQRYAPDVIHPDGVKRLESFVADPWPTWMLRLEDGTRIEQQLFTVRGAPGVIVTWNIVSGSARGVRLMVRPLMSGRDSHALHHENDQFRFEATTSGTSVRWQPYQGTPSVLAGSNGSYSHHPLWYRQFLYSEERARGLDYLEDLASPGAFHFDLSRGEGMLALAVGDGAPSMMRGNLEETLDALREDERARRRAFPSRLHRAADAYLVRRGKGMTIVAGYPWFTDWGRDTFIALRGICLATGRLDEARQILRLWAGAVSEGMLPNRFAEAGGPPEYNSVDASLWYVIAVDEFLRTAGAAGRRVSASDRRALQGAVAAIVAGYAAGTRFRIRMDDDGLLSAGEPGVQLTWMDAKVDHRVVTPRIGKPVEVEALWLNSLRIAGGWTPRWMQTYERGRASFERRFWNEQRGCLYDVADVDHVPGTADATFRPNQIFAVGGLPHPLLDGERARRVVDAVEARLLTPVGLRTLAPGEPGYAPRHEGEVRERDAAYHQGVAWPWLLGPFVEAWVRVRGNTPEARNESRERFLEPIFHHLDEAGLGHISEIADAEPPYRPRGCPFQAWSVGEILRLDQIVLRP